jgi:EmrB/QacA subfamily drug resistance transporter
MTASVLSPPATSTPSPAPDEHGSVTTLLSAALIAASLGFFIITFDAVVVNVALPSIRADLGGGIGGLQWVVDGYTLMFAALLLWSGTLTDRLGARRCFAIGLALFVVASAACGAAPSLAALIGARFVQGTAAALMMPGSMALLGHTYRDPSLRARAIAVWAIGASVAAASAPVLGGVLTLASWRLIFLINLPVGLAALALLIRVEKSPRHDVSFDWVGQAIAVTAMASLTYGAIEAGEFGLTSPRVVVPLGIAVISSALFVRVERRIAEPMIPARLFESASVAISVVIGFAFVVGYYGLPFVMSLYLQQVRGLSALAAGLTFLPMMLISTVLNPFGARFVERFGARAVVALGLGAAAVGLAVLAVTAPELSIWVIALLMVLPGLAGPLVMPPVTAVLLDSVEPTLTGTASGVFNTSRQVGGALAIAVFGALIGPRHSFDDGLRASLLIAATITVAAAALSTRLGGPKPGRDAQTTAPTVNLLTATDCCS